MMSSTRAPRLRSFTGLARPCSIGPMLTTRALRCTALYVVLPVSRSGKTKTLARPAGHRTAGPLGLADRGDGGGVVLQRAIDEQVRLALTHDPGGLGHLVHV